MENKETKAEQTVEQTTEPKLESRFGYGKSTQAISGKSAKIAAITTCVLLGLVFVLKAPNDAEQNRTQVSTPDTSELNTNQNMENLENYSATAENEKLKQSQIVQKHKIPQKLLGLQKIERRNLKQIPPATFVKAKLINAATDGLVKAVLIEPLKIQGELILQSGSILVGQAQSTEDKLVIRYNSIVFKDGTFEGIQAQAADLETKTMGLKGSRLSRYAMKYAASVGLNFVSGISQGLQEKETMGQQVVSKSNMKNALLNGASQSALEMANESMSEYKGKLPPIQVPAETEFWVVFDGGG